MDVIFTYQQDTLKNLQITVPKVGQQLQLQVNRAVVPISDLREDREVISPETTSTVKTPTAAQIRYWRWQREKKILVGNSRYIQPKTDVRLVATADSGAGIGLPNRTINTQNTDWLTILLLLILVLFATVKNTYAKYIVNLFQSLVNYSTASRMFGEKNYSILHGAVRLEVYFYFVLSVFIFQVFNLYHLQIAQQNITFFALVLGSVIGYFLLKKAIYIIIGSVFNDKNTTSEYLFNMDNFNRILGLVLFPVVALAEYFPYRRPDFIVGLGVLLVVVFYVFLLQRGALILLKKQFPIYYLFLYLCTLEFLPLILIYKMVVK